MNRDERNYSDAQINAELINQDALEKLKRKNRIKRFIRRLNYFLLSLLLIFIVVAAGMAIFLKIEYLNVSGNTIYTTEEILNESGISVGMNLYAINKKEAKSSIMARYPYVGNVVIRRTFPSTVTLNISEEPPKYYTELYGEYFVLSTGLRVLERSENADYIQNKGLMPLLLPTVKYAVVGDKIQFNNDLTFEYMENLLKGLDECEIADRLTSINVSSKYNVYVNYENRFDIYIGDNTDINTKLTFARLMIESFEENQKGRVDAHDITTGSVILDN